VSFEVLKSEIIYKGRVFDLRKEQVRLPNGNTASLDIIDHPESVTIVPVDQDGMVWFIRQYRHAVGKYMLELPAGVGEPGESPEVSAKREIREEIKMAAGELQWIGGIYLTPGYSNEYLHLYLATGLYPDPLGADEDEFMSVEKISAKQALALGETGQIEDAKSLVALFWARPYLVKLGYL
jgi:ADP-ribose pyrophosphatase